MRSDTRPCRALRAVLLALPLSITATATAEPAPCGLQYGCRLHLADCELQLTVYECGDVTVAILESRLPYVPRSMGPIFAVCDVLALSRDSADQVLVGGSPRFGVCYCGETVRRDHLALAHREGDIMVIDQAWRIDPAGPRFRAVPTAGLHCSVPQIAPPGD